MAVKGAKTIEEYKILRWVDDNFVKGTVEVKFINKNTAYIIDKVGNTLVVSIKNDKVEVV